MQLGPRYSFVRELGRGGESRVFLVRDHHLDRELALKHLVHLPVDEEGSLEREFALLAKVEHPGIARVFDFGYIDDRPYFTSEYVRGRPLGECARGLDGQTLLRFFVEIAEAVAFLHRGDVQHLDIKPSNILVPGNGTTLGRPVLIDFGLHRRGRRESPDPPLRGSLPFMAPEYFRGGTIGASTDVYALGVTFYQLLTGRYPRFASATDSSAWFESEGWDAAPVPPSSHRPDVPRDLERVVLKCLALSRRSRFRSASELLDALRRVEGGPAASPSSKTLPAQTVGRQAELSLVSSFLAGIGKEGRTADCLLVTGPPGMGQTHLFREIKVRAQTLGLRFYLETGYPGRSVAPGSLLRCLGEHAGSVAGDRRRKGHGRRRWQTFLERLRQPLGVLRDETLEGERRLRRAAEVALTARSVREPMIIAADGLQYLDEVSIELLIDLLRTFDSLPDAERPPIATVVGYREEGPAARLLHELSSFLLQPRRARVLTLGPLSVAESIELGRRLGGDSPAVSGGLRLFQESGGSPARIARTVLEGQIASRPPGGSPAARESAAPVVLGPDERRVLLTLALVERPVALAELARLVDVPRGRVRHLLGRLASSGQVRRVEVAPCRSAWIPGAAGDILDILAPAADAERRRVHGRIADEVIRQAGADDARHVEAVGHLKAAGRRRQLVEHGLAAARYLKSTFQSRGALGVYRDVLEALPRNRPGARVEVVVEMAQLYMRVGEVDDGIRVLREIFLDSRRIPASSHLRVLLWLATLYSRGGEFRRADALFREGFDKVETGSSLLSREEFLLFLNEQAAVKTFLGFHEEALALCEEGWRLSRRSRKHTVKAVALNLSATKASVALRLFDYDEAIRNFERALGIAEAIGSPGNQTVILNNLGMCYSQCDRYQDAIRAYREAEKLGLRLDEGPSLASVYGNLAILCARTGDLEEMERVLSEADKLTPGTLGRKQEYFLEHAHGLCLVIRGRYTAARPHLEKARKMGEALGDRYVVPFEELYLAEAMLFEARYRDADDLLAGLTDPSRPSAIRRPALARLALTGALTSKEGAALDAVARFHEIEDERPIAFLEASSGIYLGWALSILERYDEARSHLARSERYFRRHGLRPSLSLVLCVRAESEWLAGRADAAADIVESPASPASELAAVLRSLLRARLLIETGRTTEDEANCADALAEAGALLVGHRLPEWSRRLDALRRRLTGDPAPADRSVSPSPGGVGSAYWKRWVEDFELPVAWTAGRGGRPNASPSEPPDEAPGSDTVPLRRAATGRMRREVVARSRPMQRLLGLVDRLRASDIPVLIRGETGSGKELVARVIHEESCRAAAPFRVVDCATIPPALLESELFGASPGAFTDQVEGRQGLLLAANGGTLLFDEVGGASLEVQAKLLRLLSGGVVRPLGSDEERTVDVRFLFSSALDLQRAVEEGRFREDLYHRIHVLTLEVPPLRERPEDLEELVKRFLSAEGAESAEGAGPDPYVESGVIQRLRLRPWPGNVRELKNLVLRLRLEGGEKITTESLEGALESVEPEDTRRVFPRNLLADGSLPALKKELEREYILYHYRRLEGRTKDLCRFLGVGPRHFYRMCQRLGVRLREERRSLGSRGGEGPPA